MKSKMKFERFIIAKLIHEPELIPIAESSLAIEDFTGLYKEAIIKIFSFSKDVPAEDLKGYLVIELNSIEGYRTSETLDSYNELAGGIEMLIHLIEKLKEENRKQELSKILIDFNNKLENSYSIDLINQIQDKLESLNHTDSNVELSFNEDLERLIDEIGKDKNNTSADVYKTNSFPSFDTATGGLRGSNLVGIAGAWKNGKTTFAMNLILDYVKNDIPCLLIPLEMGEHETKLKVLSALSGISYEKLRNPKKLQSEDDSILVRYYHSNKNKSLPLFIETRSRTENQIRGTIKRHVHKHNIKIVMIDYIGLIAGDNQESRERHLSSLSNSLKQLATELNIVIIVLAQLNRKGLEDASSVNLAESIGLARDSDFFFTISKVKDTDTGLVSKFQLDKTAVGNYFIVKLDASRHTQSGKVFMLNLSEEGKLNEIHSQFNNEYIKKAI